MLKADLHVHTNEDPLDFSKINYSARDLIKYAAKLHYNVLAITNHNSILYDHMLKSYAKKHGILLIPGTEADIEGKEILLLNVKKHNTKNISGLHKLRKQDILTVAPHPFYPKLKSLHSKLIKNIDCFDAIEYSHFYCKFFNPFNKKAVKIARKYKKPLIGTSDAHNLSQMNHTFSLIDAKPKIDSVLEAVRKSKIIIKTEPLSFKHYFITGLKALPYMFR